MRFKEAYEGCQTIARYGLFASLYSDRGSHYSTTPEAGGKMDKVNLTEY